LRELKIKTIRLTQFFGWHYIFLLTIILQNILLMQPFVLEKTPFPFLTFLLKYGGKQSILESSES
jgi:hypothetical protein